MVTVLVSSIISRLLWFLPLAEGKHQRFAKLPATEIGDTAVNFYVCCIRWWIESFRPKHTIQFYVVACLLPESFTDIDNV